MSKYKAQRCGKYASKREANRASELKILEIAGLVCDLKEQVVFELAGSVVIQGRKRPPLRYIADFVYSDGGKTIVEDVKGVITDAYRIKRHLMKSVHGIDILET